MKSRLTITALALVAGLTILFYGHEIPIIKGFDASCTHLYTTSDSIIHDDDFESGTISFLTTTPINKKPEATYQRIAITDDPDQIFEKSPPSPLDYAVILEKLHEQKQQKVILATQASWDNYTDMELQALDGRLGRFQQVIISLPVTRGATKAPLPPSLQRSVIPTQNIRGQYSTLPVVNQVTLKNHANGGKQTYAGFSTIESNEAPQTDAVQMLALWKDEGVIPSFQLLSLMSAYSITPTDIIIHCGKHIRLGEKGAIIPIDEFGKTNTPINDSLLELTSTPAEQLMNQTQSKQHHPSKPIAIIQATGAVSQTVNSISTQQFSKLLKTSKDFLQPGQQFSFKKLPLWAEAAILGNLCLAIYIALCFSGLARQYCMLMISISIFVTLLAFMHTLQSWFTFSALVSTLLLSWLLSLFTKKATS